MATPRMPSLIPRRPRLAHYVFAAAIGWATSYYTFQPLLEQQVSQATNASCQLSVPSFCTLTLGSCAHTRPANGQRSEASSRSQMGAAAAQIPPSE